MRSAAVAAIVLLGASASGQDAYNAGITISHGEKYFAVGNSAHAIWLHRLTDGKLVRKLAYPNRGLGGFLTKPAFSPDDRYLSAGSVAPDGGVNPVWELGTGRIVAQISIWADQETPFQMGLVGFSPQGGLVLGATYGLFGMSGEVVAFDRKSATIRFLSRAGFQEQAISAISPTEPLVISVSGQQFDAWSPSSSGPNRWKSSFLGDLPEETAYLAFSGDGQVLGFAGDGWVAAYDPRKLPTSGIIQDTGRKIDNQVPVRRSAVVPDFVVRSLCLNHTGTQAFIGARDGRIAVFNLRTRQLIKTWKAAPEPIKSLAVTKNGKLLLAYDLERIRYFELPSGRLIRTVKSGAPRP